MATRTWPNAPAMFPSVSPRAVRDVWRAKFQAHADRILDELAGCGQADLVKAFALPLSAECLKDITGLTNMRYQDMDASVAGDDRRHRQTMPATRRSRRAVTPRPPASMPRSTT